MATNDMEVVEWNTTPTPGDQGVQNVLRNLEDHLQMRGTIAMIESVGKYMYIATNASARDAKQLIKVQDCLFNIIKLNDACSLMMQSFQSGANNILEKLKVAYLYLLDGFPDFAMTDIEAITKDVGSMQNAVDKHLISEKKTAEKIAETHVVVTSQLNSLQNGWQDLQMQDEKKECEVKELEKRVNGAGLFGVGRRGYQDRSNDGPNQQGKKTASGRLSKLYLFLLILLALKYSFYIEVCDGMISEPDKIIDEWKYCLQIHLGIGFAVLPVLLLKWIRDSKCRRMGNAILICMVCSLVFFPVWYQQDGRFELIGGRETTTPGNETHASSTGGFFVEGILHDQSNHERDGQTSEAHDESDMTGKVLTDFGENVLPQLDAKSSEQEGRPGRGNDEVTPSAEWYGKDGSASSEQGKQEKGQKTDAETIQENEDERVHRGQIEVKLSQGKPSPVTGKDTEATIKYSQDEAHDDEMKAGSISKEDDHPSMVKRETTNKVSSEGSKEAGNGSSETDMPEARVCHQPETWYLVILFPFVFITLYGVVKNKDSEDCFIGLIVILVSLLLFAGLFWPLVLNENLEMPMIVPFGYFGAIGFFEIAGIGTLLSFTVAIIISCCILTRQEVNQNVDEADERPKPVFDDYAETLRIARDELTDIQIRLTSAKERFENTELTDILFSKSLPYMAGIEDVLSKSIKLVENWYKECKDVVEPNMGRNIDRAAGIDDQERQRYWNSLQFKQEVVGYYCRLVPFS
jgi:hypothetical protein